MRFVVQGIRLRHPATIADIQRQHLLLRAGGYLVVHDDHEEIYAHLQHALDEAGEPIPDEWIARPLNQDEVAELRAQGA